MSTLEQAMRMALEALESCTPADTSTGHVVWPSYDEKAVGDAIAALREALEQQAQVEPVFWYRPRSDGVYEGPIHNTQIENVRKESGAWVPLVPATAQPAQEGGTS